MKRNLPFWATGLLLAAALAGAFFTRESSNSRSENKRAEATAGIDSRLLDTARSLAALAETGAEQEVARTILQDADHEFDQAFASALREAAASGPPATGPLKQLADREAAILSRIEAAQAEAAKLEAKAKTDDDAAARLELIQAQIALDQDEAEEVRQDLARQGGDRRATLERMKKAHEEARTAANGKPPAPPPAGTGWEQVRALLALRSMRDRVEAAREQAAAKAASLVREHQALEQLLANKPAPAVSAVPAEGEEDTDEMLARLKHLSDQRKTLAELDKRIDDTQQIAGAYRRWESLLDGRIRSVVHALLISIVWMLAVVLAAFALRRAIHYAFRRQGDPRAAHQLRTLANVVVAAVCILAITLIVAGVPTQTSTIIGLTTAGLTVALKDFIVGFFGWFALIGRNGIRVGDWVEIEGVGGEVIDIGLLKTTLLEMGDWTNSGHRTGRRVSFSNKFAIENHYFNFSTAGQWLWDVLRITLPDTSSAYQMAARIREMVKSETEADARLAEQEWERVTRQYGARPFSTEPVIDLRPTTGGLEVQVRYITRAPERFEVKSRLLDQTVALVHAPAAQAAG